MAEEDAGPPAASAVVALAALVVLAVATPWPFGSTDPLAVRVVSLVALGVAVGAAADGAARRAPLDVPAPFWAVAALVALGALQLVPLPAALHALVAPGSHAVWHPAEPAAATVLGSGARPLSIHPEATRRWLAFTGGLAALAVFARPALGDRRLAGRAVAFVVTGGLAVAVYGIVARTLFGPLLFGRIAVPTVSPFGPFVSKNHFAGYVAMAALLALGLATGRADDARRGRGALGWVGGPEASGVLAAGGAAAAMALAVLVSLSRGGAVALAGGFAAFLGLRVYARHHRRGSPAPARILPVVAAFAVAAAALVAVLPREGRERIASLGSVTDEESGGFRLAVWRDALRLSVTSPFLGHGLGAFVDALPRGKTAAGILRVEHAENDYLELGVEAGALGLSLAAVAAALWLGAFARGLPRQDDRLGRGLGLGAAGALAALLLHSFFDFNLRIPSNAVLFTFAATLAAANAWPRRRVGPGVTIVALVALLATLLVTPVADDASWIPTVRRAGAGRLYFRRAEDALRAHLRRRPADAEAWLLLAWVHAARGDTRNGTALATHAVRLDPERERLRREAERLGAAAP